MAKPNWGRGIGMGLSSLGQSMMDRAMMEQRWRQAQELEDARTANDKELMLLRDQMAGERARADFERDNPYTVPGAMIDRLRYGNSVPVGIPGYQPQDGRTNLQGLLGINRALAPEPVDVPPAITDYQAEMIRLAEERLALQRQAQEMDASGGVGGLKQTDLDRAVFGASGPTSAARLGPPGTAIDSVGGQLYGPTFITDFRAALKSAIANGEIDINDTEAQRQLALAVAAGHSPRLSVFGDDDPRSSETAYDPGTDTFYDPSLKNQRSLLGIDRLMKDSWLPIPGTVSKSFPKGEQYSPVPRDEFWRKRVMPAMERGWMDEKTLFEAMKKYGVDDGTLSLWMGMDKAGAAEPAAPVDDDLLGNLKGLY